jgi:hypothetical protein
LGKQLKTNDKHNAKLSKIIEQGKELVATNKVLRAAIESSADVSLIKSVALVPFKPPSAFSGTAKKNRKKRKSADSDSESN